MRKTQDLIVWLQTSLTGELFWLRLFTILAVILLSIGLGYFGSDQSLLLGLGVIVAVPFLLVLLRYPVLGLMGTLISGLVISYSGPGGVNATVGFVALCGGLWIFDMVVLRNEIRLVSSRICVPVYVLVVLAFIAFGMGQLSFYYYVPLAPLDAQIGGFAVFILSFGGLLLIANQIKTLSELRWITWTFILFGSIFVVYALLKASGFLTTALSNAFSVIFGSAQQGGMFWIWFIALAFGQALFNDDLPPMLRIFFLGMVIIAIYILFVLQFKNKSGWVPAFIVLWVILTLRSWPWGLALLVTGGIGLLTLIPQVMESEEYSLSTRLEILPIYWQILRVNPLFGIGFANYRYVTPLFSLRGYFVEFNSHNNYVDIAVQTGLLGLISYLWFLFEVAYVSFRLRYRNLDGFSKAYLNGALGGLVGTAIVGMLGDWVLPFVYNIGLNGFRISLMAWLLLGGVVVLDNLYGNSSAHSPRKGW